MENSLPLGFFNSLSPDIIEEFLKYVDDPKDLLAFSQTCKLTRAVALELVQRKTSQEDRMNRVFEGKACVEIAKTKEKLNLELEQMAETFTLVWSPDMQEKLHKTFLKTTSLESSQNTLRELFSRARKEMEEEAPSLSSQMKRFRALHEMNLLAKQQLSKFDPSQSG
jgi:hypothetical protein